MDVVIQQLPIFVQQLINGITLGSIYGLIAIGYTMVFGIIGMVNFAHGDVFMVSAFIALIAFLILTSLLGISTIALALVIVLIVAILMTSLVNWTIERLAYRPLRGSFRLAPLISAIGMSIFLSNFVQVVQGPRNKPLPPLLDGVIDLTKGAGFDVTISYKQIAIMCGTSILLLVFLTAQITLGVLTVLMRKPADIASAHVAVGALILVTTFVLTVRAIRLFAEKQQQFPAPIADRRIDLVPDEQQQQLVMA